MKSSSHPHHPQTGPHPPKDPRLHGPYWRRAHRDWRFWVAVAAIAIALGIYVTSVDLILVPGT